MILVYRGKDKYGEQVGGQKNQKFDFELAPCLMPFPQLSSSKKVRMSSELTWEVPTLKGPFSNQNYLKIQRKRPYFRSESFFGHNFVQRAYFLIPSSLLICILAILLNNAKKGHKSLKLMAIIGAAIQANITNMAIMATLTWPLMSNNQTILGVFPEN